MTSFAKAAKRRTGQLSWFLIHRSQFDTGAGDKLVQITQSFGAISGFNNNRGLRTRPRQVRKLTNEVQSTVMSIDGSLRWKMRRWNLEIFFKTLLSCIVACVAA